MLNMENQTQPPQTTPPPSKKITIYTSSNWNAIVEDQSDSDSGQKEPFVRSFSETKAMSYHVMSVTTS